MGFHASLLRVCVRVQESNNRSLGTLFGCLCGCILGIVLLTNPQLVSSFPVVGAAVSWPLQVIGVLLATGTGGNLSSYIGAAIDILTGERTIFDLCCRRDDQGAPTGAARIEEKQPLSPKPHPHFPFITSTEQAVSRHLHPSHQASTLAPHAEGAGK
jgi:hypothetical protein